MKKVLSVLLVLTMAIMLAACGGSAASPAASSEAAPAASSEAASTEAASSEAAPAASGDFRVAMLLPGTINDNGWNAEAYEGLKLVEEELGAEVTYTEKVAASSYEEVFRGYADMGYNLIVGHGFEFGDAACAVAPDYPDVFFAITSSDVSQEPNVCGVQNMTTQQGFLAGALAAMCTESKKVGAIGGMEIPSITGFIEGFQKGVAYVDDSVEALTTFTGDFDDVAKCKQMAEAMINEGADIVCHDANQAGLGVFEAVSAAPENVKTIGAVGDQYELAPDRVLTSVQNLLSRAILTAAEMCKNGELEPKGYQFGVAEGTVFVADYRGAVSDDIQAKMAEIEKGLGDGSIDAGTF